MTLDHLPLFNTRIESLVSVTPMIVVLTLSCPTSFVWQAGDYIWLGLNDESMKPFSIANYGSSSYIECHIALTDTMTVWLDALNKAESISIRGPVQQYHWPTENANILLVAGGTGITPLINLLHQHIRIKQQQPIVLYWGIRNLSFAYLESDLNTLVKTYPHFSYHLVLSEPSSDWQGLKGLIPEVIANMCTPHDNDHCLICGPWPMVNAVKTWAKTFLPNHHIQS